MHILFLRGSVPDKSENPQKLLYDTIENCEDMWTQLFYFITKELSATAELLYQNGKRSFIVDDDFVEKWIPKFKKYIPDHDPDLIVCRGGFGYYEHILKKYSKAKKVYYGAGVRSFPKTPFTAYDLFLVDSEKQFIKIKNKGKNVSLFIKPASLLFKPVETEKKYDICFVGNGSHGHIKRHELLLQSFAGSNLSILNIGIRNKQYIKMAKKLNVNIKWDGWHLRKKLPSKISQCRIGICCSTNYDSCPRVIPEYLACNIPVVVTSNVNFWHDKYINTNTGFLVKDKNIKNAAKKLLKLDLKPINYYRDSLDMSCAASYLRKLISEIM